MPGNGMDIFMTLACAGGVANGGIAAGRPGPRLKKSRSAR